MLHRESIIFQSCCVLFFLCIFYRSLLYTRNGAPCFCLHVSPARRVYHMIYIKWTQYSFICQSHKETSHRSDNHHSVQHIIRINIHPCVVQTSPHINCVHIVPSNWNAYFHLKKQNKEYYSFTSVYCLAERVCLCVIIAI